MGEKWVVLNTRSDFSPGVIAASPVIFHRKEDNTSIVTESDISVSGNVSSSVTSTTTLTNNYSGESTEENKKTTAIDTFS